MRRSILDTLVFLGIFFLGRYLFDFVEHDTYAYMLSFAFGGAAVGLSVFIAKHPFKIFSTPAEKL